VIGTAGGGLVTATVSGGMELKDLTIEGEAAATYLVRMLRDFPGLGDPLSR
jgi:DNA-binding protein YbaB